MLNEKKAHTAKKTEEFSEFNNALGSFWLKMKRHKKETSTIQLLPNPDC